MMSGCASMSASWRMRMDWSRVGFNNSFTDYVVILLFIKEKEVFMQSTVYSWKPSVSIA